VKVFVATLLAMLSSAALAHENCFETHRDQFDRSWFNSIQNELALFAKKNGVSVAPNSIQLSISRVLKNSIYGMSDDYASYRISLQGSLKTTSGIELIVFTGDQEDFAPADLGETSGVQFRPRAKDARYDQLGNLTSAGHCLMEIGQGTTYDSKILIANAKSGKVIGSIPVTSVTLY